MTQRAMIVDDEVNMRWVLKEALTDFGYEVVTAGSGQEALALMGQTPADLIILDLKMKGMDGLGTLARLRERWPEVVVIILTAHGTVATAVEAMQLGAADYLRKPFDVEEVGFKIQRALERKTLQAEVVRLRQAAIHEPDPIIVGEHPCWQQCLTQVTAPATFDYDVWLTGEPGTGKAALARLSHRVSPRQGAPYLVLDPRIFPPSLHRDLILGTVATDGMWSRAGDGTLVLVHAEVLDGAAWEHMHEVVRRRSRGPRLVVTSTDALSAPWPMAQVLVPPLRKRIADLPILAMALVPGIQWTDDALQALERYDWPGNVAEFKSVLERAAVVAAGAPIEPGHLPHELRVVPMGDVPIQLPTDGVSLEAVEVALIRQALERVNGNKTRAAELLGITRHTLIYRLEKYGLELRDPASGPSDGPEDTHDLIP